MFPAVADEAASFDCETSPLPPLLATATGLELFDAPSCHAPDRASAPWWFFAD